MSIQPWRLLLLLVGVCFWAAKALDRMQWHPADWLLVTAFDTTHVHAGVIMHTCCLTWPPRAHEQAVWHVYSRRWDGGTEMHAPVQRQTGCSGRLGRKKEKEQGCTPALVGLGCVHAQVHVDLKATAFFSISLYLLSGLWLSMFTVRPCTTAPISWWFFCCCFV